MRHSNSRTWLIGLVVCLLPGLIASQPVLRRTLAVQLLGHSPLYAGYGHVPFLSGSLSVWRLDDAAQQTSSFSDHDPQSEVALFLENAMSMTTTRGSQAASSPEEFSRDLCHKIDEIRRRFPDAKNTVWLCALRAQWGLLWMRHNRLAGEMTDPDWKLHRAQGIAPPEKGNWAPNFTQRDVTEALEAVGQGARVEPNNAYWDWLRAQYLTYIGHDPEAWQALENGARKTRFEAHNREVMQGYVAAYEKTLGRPLLPEEINVVRQTARDFSFLGRGMARILAWQALKAQRRGQHDQALKIYYGFCSLQLLRAQNAYRVDEAQNSLSLVSLILSRERAAGNLLVTDTNLDNGLGADLRAIETYAARYTSPSRIQQIKTLTNRVRQQSVQQRNLNHIMVSGRYYEGMNALLWQLSLGTFGAGTILLQQAILAAVLWLLLGVALTMLLPPHKVFNKPIESSDSAIGISLLALIIMMMAYGSLRESGRLGGGESWPLFAISSQLSGLDEAATVVYSWGLLVPVLFSSILAQGMTIWRATPTHPEVRKANKSEKAQGREAPSERVRGELALAPIVGRLTLFLFSVSMLIWWQNALTEPTAVWVIPRRVAFLGLDMPGGSRTIHWAALHPLYPLTLAVAGLVLGWTRWIFASPPQRRGLISYRLHWLHQLLGAAALMTAAGYVAISIYMLPTRYKAEREVQTLIQRGDNALWQQRLREQSPTTASELTD